MAVHLGHLQLVFVVRHGAQPADDAVGPFLLGEIHQQAAETLDFNQGFGRLERFDHLPDDLDALLDREQRRFLLIYEDADGDLVEQLAAALDDVEMAVGDGIKRAGIHGTTHGWFSPCREGERFRYGNGMARMLTRGPPAEQRAAFSKCHGQFRTRRINDVFGCRFVRSNARILPLQPTAKDNFGDCVAGMGDLLNKLLLLTPGQFEVLLDKISAPREYLPGPNSEPAIQVTGLLRWARSPGGCGLPAIENALATLPQTINQTNTTTSATRGRAMEELNHIERQLDLLQEQRRALEEEMTLSTSAMEKIRLKQQVREQLLPKIRGFEQQLADFLVNRVSESEIAIQDAEVIEGEIVTAIEAIERLPVQNRADEAMQLLREIHLKLNEPGKTAAGKLKVALPLLPTIVSYEMELDTESALVTAWRKLVGLFKRSARNPQ